MKANFPPLIPVLGFGAPSNLDGPKAPFTAPPRLEVAV